MQLLQERLPPDLHRHEAAGGRCPALHHRDVREGDGRVAGRPAEGQGAVRPDQEGKPELRRDRRGRRLPEHGQPKDGRGGQFAGLRPPIGESGPVASPLLRPRPAGKRSGSGSRVLNFYSTAPFFVGYLESAGVPFRNIVFSTETATRCTRRDRAGGRSTSASSKAVISHVHQLIQASGKKGKSLDLIFFPALMNLQSSLTNTLPARPAPPSRPRQASSRRRSRRRGTSSPKRGSGSPIRSCTWPSRPSSTGRWAFWRQVLRLSRKEHRAAMETGWQAMDRFANEVQRAPARALLDRLEAEGRVGVVLLGRPYHNDPGLNHEILTEIQKRGYPVFTMDSSRRTRTSSTASSARRSRRARSRTRWTSPTSGRTPTAPTPRGRSGPPSSRPGTEPGGRRPLELQVRPRRAYLRRRGVDPRGDGDALFFVPRHRREPAGRLDQDSHRNDRLFPAAV